MSTLQRRVAPIGTVLSGSKVLRSLLLAATAATAALVPSGGAHALTAIEQHGLDVDLIDPRTIKPLDIGSIVASVRRTGRLLVVDYDFPFGGFGAEVAAQVTERAFASLTRPPLRIGFPDRGMPSSGVLERAYYPTPDRLAAAMQALIAGDVVTRELADEVVAS